jgi:hypothetical protein
METKRLFTVTIMSPITELTIQLYIIGESIFDASSRVQKEIDRIDELSGKCEKLSEREKMFALKRIIAVQEMSNNEEKAKNNYLMV